MAARDGTDALTWAEARSAHRQACVGSRGQAAREVGLRRAVDRGRRTRPDTTRQAVYRRWPTKASLAAAALQRAVEEPATPDDSLHPYRDLVAELANFQRGVSRPGRMSLVGTMLQDGIDPTVRARYQERVIAPRRRRLRAILERAREQGLIDEECGPRDRSHSRRGLLVRARACRLETTARLARTHGGTRLASRRRQPVSELTLLDSARELVLSGPEAVIGVVSPVRAGTSKARGALPVLAKRVGRAASVSTARGPRRSTAPPHRSGQRRQADVAVDAVGSQVCDESNFRAVRPESLDDPEPAGCAA